MVGSEGFLVSLLSLARVCRPARSGLSRWALVVFALLGLVSSMAVPSIASAAAPSAQPLGLDISWPQCRTGIPVSEGNLAIVGVTGGRAFTINPCFSQEYQAARSQNGNPSLYMNLNYPSGPSATRGTSGPRGQCQPQDQACQAYNYGYNAAQEAETYARSIASVSSWWLDVETANYWSSNTALNAQVIQGAIDYLKGRGLNVGIYSIAPMWHRIAGNYAPKLPNWVAQTQSTVGTMQYCGAGYSFGGGSVSMVQSWNGKYDVDFACTGGQVLVPPATGPITLTGRAQGTLVGASGGATVEYETAYPGNGSYETVTLDYGPNGPNVANALFINVTQAGQSLLKVHATDTSSPGHITLNFASPSSAPVTIQLVNYNDPANVPPITYTLTQAQ